MIQLYLVIYETYYTRQPDFNDFSTKIFQTEKEALEFVDNLSSVTTFRVERLDLDKEFHLQSTTILTSQFMASVMKKQDK